MPGLKNEARLVSHHMDERLYHSCIGGFMHTTASGLCLIVAVGSFPKAVWDMSFES